MAIALVAFSTGQGVGASVSANKPAGLVEGHVMAAFVGTEFTLDTAAGDTVNVPSGWTFVGQAYGSNVDIRVYRKVAGASEPASYAWGFAAGVDAAIAIGAYSGVDAANPINAQGFSQNASAVTAQSAPSVTTTADGCQILRAHNLKRTDSTVAPDMASGDGSTERFDIRCDSVTASWSMTCEGADHSQGTAGPTGTLTATSTPACTSAHVTLALSASLPADPLDLVGAVGV